MGNSIPCSSESGAKLFSMMILEITFPILFGRQRRPPENLIQERLLGGTTRNTNSGGSNSRGILLVGMIRGDINLEGSNLKGRGWSDASSSRDISSSSGTSSSSDTSLSSENSTAAYITFSVLFKMQLSGFPSLLSAASAIFVCASALTTPPLPVSTVVDFGLGFWIENIRVRSSGEILAVGPFSYQVDP